MKTTIVVMHIAHGSGGGTAIREHAKHIGGTVTEVNAMEAEHKDIEKAFSEPVMAVVINDVGKAPESVRHSIIHAVANKINTAL